MTSPADTPPAASGSRAKKTQEFPCPECGDIFYRLDHAARHIQSHKPEKPFVCPTCNKGFNRADSLNRHYKAHDDNSDPTLSKIRTISSRVSSACQKCSAAKLRCGGGDPCGRCQGKGLRCTYAQRSRRRVKSNTVPMSREPMPPCSQASDENEVMPRSLDIDFGGAVRTEDMHSVDYHALMALTEAAMQTSTPLGSGYRLDDQQTQGTVSIQSENSSCLGPFPGPASQSIVNDSDLQHATEANATDFNLLSPPQTNTSQDRVGDWRESERVQDLSLDETTVTSFESHPNGSTNFDDLGFDPIYNASFEIMDWTTFDCTWDFSMPSMQPEYSHYLPSGYHSQPPMVNSAVPPRDAFASNQTNNAAAFRSVQIHEHTPLPTPLLEETPPSPLRNNAQPMSSPPQPSTTQRIEFSGAGEIQLDQESQRRMSQPRPQEHWPTDWDPRKNDNAVSFPDLHDAATDILETENFAHVPQLSHQVYNSIINCVIELGNNQQFFRPFVDSALPSLETFNCFVQLYFEYFQPVFPILHQATFDPTSAPWVLVLAVAAIGGRFSKIRDSTRCASSLEELLRRAIQHSCEKDNSKARQIWVAQVMVLNMIGMVYSGDKRLLELALVNKNGMITTCRRNGSLRQSAHGMKIDDSLTGGRLDMAWKQWTIEESYRRLGFSSWLVDCQLPLYFDMSPSMSLVEIQQQLPCQESLWAASNAEAWKKLFIQQSRSGTIPNIHGALQSLCNNANIGPTIGDFGRIILVHAIYQTTWELRQQARNPLLRSNPILYSERTLPTWQNVATSALDALLPPFTDTVQRTSLQLNLTAHVHHVALLVHVPLTALLAYAGSQAANHAVHDAQQELAVWMREESGRTARKAVLHACILFSIIRSRPCRGSHEPVAILISTLTIWAFHQHSRHTLNPRATTVRLDRIEQDAMAQYWINDGAELRGYLTDVGNICSLGAGKRLLQLACRVLATMDAWNMSLGFSNVLNALQMRLSDPLSS